MGHWCDICHGVLTGGSPCGPDGPDSDYDETEPDTDPGYDDIDEPSPDDKEEAKCF